MKLFESFVSFSPLKLNPYAGILSVVGLAYLPHFLKLKFVKDKLDETHTTLSFADSRQQSDSCMDNSELGHTIAIFRGCHQNGLESIAYFSAAVLSAISAGVDRSIIEKAVGLFVVIRTMYTGIYLSPLNGPLRTLTWASGFFVSSGLLWSSYKKSA